MINVLQDPVIQINADLTAQAHHLSHIIVNALVTQTVAPDIALQTILARILALQPKVLDLIMMLVTVLQALIVYRLHALQIFAILIVLVLQLY